jgi:hypothetical protein
MTGFDLMAGIDEATLNAGVATVYQQLQSTMFQGGLDIPELNLTVSFDVQQAPAFNLSGTTVAERIRAGMSKVSQSGAYPGLAEHLEETVAAAAGQSFELDFAAVQMTLTGGSYNVTQVFAMSVICQASTNSSGQITFEALSATATASTDDTSLWILNQRFLPLSLKYINSHLQNLAVPPIALSGIALSAPVLTVSSGYFIAVMNLAASGVPSVPTGFTCPAGAGCFAYMSQALLQASANAATQSFSYTYPKSGSFGVSDFNVNYSFTLNITDLSATVTGPQSMNFGTTAGGNAQASVRVFVDIGFNFNLYGKPNPSGNIGISINGTNVHATVTRLNAFDILLAPSGNPVQWLLSLILTPLTNAISAIVSPIVSSQLNGFGFDIWTISTISVPLSGETFVITPSNLVSTVAPDGSYLQVTGDATVSVQSQMTALVS